VIILARRVVSILPLALFSVAIVASSVAAHSLPNRFDPGRDTTVRSAPREVRIRFGGDIEAAFSTIEVKDAAGRRVDKGDARLDERNPRILRVSLHPLEPGVYRVTWQILAIDGHRNEGAYGFTVTLSE
jgi:methionine-rich copper-binding protein CopC